ncbi:hypothetical protein Y032_0164g3558 [Ancylostoma ceylanicum]|uniref:Uncharacterized protein n=1 Tax=Ancylostoma ceylanicum TaxID=53326 RepID=A0A016SWM3_9BILA|nr:hypothetical protein Y032_0164g3558 [Ancylostoma ceylanicum]
MAESNNAETNNGDDRRNAARNEHNEVEVAEVPQQARGTPAPVSYWKQVMNCIGTRCDNALTEQLRNLSTAKRKYIVGAVQCAVDIVVAAVERENNENEQFRTVLSALGLQPQQLVQMLPRLTRHAADLTQLAIELNCDIASVRNVVRENDEEVERLRSQLAVLQAPPRAHIEPQAPAARGGGQGEWSQELRQMIKDWNTVADVQYKSFQQDVHHPSAELMQPRDGPQWSPALNLQGRSARSSTMCSHLDPQDLLGEFSDLTSLSNDSRNGKTETVSTVGGQDNQVLSTLREVLKAQTVADVKKYNGKNSLSDFLRALEVKYPRTIWSDSDRGEILINHLEGTTNTLVSNLSNEIRRGTFEALVEELRKARVTPGERLKAASEWKQLQKTTKNQ